MKLNLHTHTRWSDGYLSLLELINYAKKQSLEYLALTDHDRTKAWSQQNIEEGTRYASGGIKQVSHGILQSEELKIIEGIELSTNDNGKDVHILGLFMEKPDEEFQIYLDYIMKFRWCRAGRIAERLGVETAELMKEVGDGIPSRLHFGYIKYLEEMKKNRKERDPKISCARDVMKKYVGPQTEGYVSFEMDNVYTPQRAIERILKSRGIPIWAHPERVDMPLEDTFKRYLDYAKGKPFGVEVTEQKNLTDMMNKFCLVTIGNDFHGYPYEPEDKPLAVEAPQELIQRLEEAHKAITK